MRREDFVEAGRRQGNKTHMESKRNQRNRTSRSPESYDGRKSGNIGANIWPGASRSVDAGSVCRGSEAGRFHHQRGSQTRSAGGNAAGRSERIRIEWGSFCSGQADARRKKGRVVPRGTSDDVYGLVSARAEPGGAGSTERRSSTGPANHGAARKTESFAGQQVDSNGTE